MRSATFAFAITFLLFASASHAAAQQVDTPVGETQVAALRAKLAAHPSDFEAALELATALHQLDHDSPNGGKRVSEAAAAYSLAAELAPAGQPAVRAYVLSNLGALLLGAGRVEEAGRTMNASLALAEQLGLAGTDLYCGTLFNLAKAEQQLGRQQASQALLARVLQLARGVAGSTYLKAWAALKSFTAEQVDELEECWEYLRRSEQGGECPSTSLICPPHIPPPFPIASFLRLPSSSFICGTFAITPSRSALLPNSSSTRPNFVSLHSIPLFSYMPPPHFTLSTCALDEAGLGWRQRQAWHTLQSRWAWLDGLGAVDKSWVGFGVFHAREQAGQYEGAWQALQWANRLQDDAAPYNSAQDDANTAAVMNMFRPPKHGSSDRAEAFYAALMAGKGGYFDPATRPVFVMGMPRSGSTLVEQILASHSQVWGAGEDTALAPLLPALLQVLQSKGEVEASRIAAVGRQYVDEMKGRLPAGKAGARWIVDKMLRNIWNVGFIAMMLPGACLIHAVRHPADTGLSCYAQPFEGRGTPWAANLSSIAHQLQLVHLLADHWDAVLPGRLLQVRYCDLVRDQEATTRRMLQHCGIPWEPAVLSFHTTQRTVATASLAQVRQQLYSSSVLRYRRYASHLAPLLRPLASLILRYERDARLDSSQQLLAEVLGEKGGRGGDQKEEL